MKQAKFKVKKQAMQSQLDYLAEICAKSQQCDSANTKLQSQR
jgi:hypothetical protein